MNAVKLISRIVAPDLTPSDLEQQQRVSDSDMSGEQQFNKMLHDHTYGITLDPMILFSVVFSTLIHDVDHQGVSNAQLQAEESTLAMAYDNKSIAEQNSVDLGWRLLMGDKFLDFRRAIYSNVQGYHRFRSLVVNSVMATDIMDKELIALRNQRWDQAFSNSQDDGDDADDDAADDDDDSSSHSSSLLSKNKQNVKMGINRKATIVIEHLIQASDVSHTMQHWHIYCKWNERLFCELYRAYKDGRLAKNPVSFWYQGEIGFFEYYIIPLARKLETCGVFGVSSHELLGYASQNLEEWKERGQEIVAMYEAKYCHSSEETLRETSVSSTA
jgi:hypothetical protein